MRKLTLSLVYGCGLVSCTVVFGVVLALCIVDPSIDYRSNFDPGGNRDVGVSEYAMRTTVGVGSRTIELPFPLVKLSILVLGLLSLVTIGYLLRAIIRLHRRTTEALTAEQVADVEHRVLNGPARVE